MISWAVSQFQVILFKFVQLFDYYEANILLNRSKLLFSYTENLVFL